MRRIQYVCVDELDVGANARQEIFMAFLDMLTPELRALEELGAFGNFTAELVSVLLFHELDVCQSCPDSSQGGEAYLVQLFF